MSTLGARSSEGSQLPTGAQFLPNLSEAQIAQAAEQVHGIWGGEHEPLAYLEHVREQISRSGGSLEYAGIVDEQGVVLASFKRYSIEIVSPARPIPTLGIGAVFTAEAERGRGLAKIMLGEAMRHAQANGNDLALLFSEIDPRYYQGLGFELLPASTHHAATDELPKDPNIELTPCDDFAAMLELYDQSWPKSSWHRKRTAASFRYWAWRHGERARFLVSRGKKSLGYISVALRAHALWIEDAVRVETPPETLWAAFAKLARKSGREQVAGWLRPADAGGPFVEQPRRLCVPMAYTLNSRDSLLPQDGAYFSALDSF